MYWNRWEDWLAGMYGTESTVANVRAARGLLCDPDAFMEAAREMVREWPTAAVHNLTHLWTGRNAWVGQATCCYSLNITGTATREAWGSMTLDQQRAANEVATQVRIEWERRDVQTLFAN